MCYRLAALTETNKLVEIVQTEHAKTSKMAGIPSFSTSCVMNPICQARIRDGHSVCAHCYADHILKFRKGTRDTTAANYVVLTTEKLLRAPTICWTADALRRNPDKLARIESFGDVASVQQAANYIRIVKANPDARFAAWTKNLKLWVTAFELEGKPENLTMVFSSMEVSKPDAIPDWAMKWVDHRFTVYTREFLEAHGIKSNCAGISCATCQRCYYKDTAFDIMEILR